MASANLHDLARAERQSQERKLCRIFCCASTGCLASNSQTVLDAVTQAVASHDLAEHVDIVPAGCMGLCSLGPLLRVEPKGHAAVMYQSVDPLLARLIVAEHIVPVVAAVAEGRQFPLPPFLSDHTISLDLPFFALQEKVVLRDMGNINPERIEEYLAVDGYQALEKVLKEMTPDQVIDVMTRSGIRGRGGAGFKTGVKWQLTRDAPGDEKFMICNGDEGDPGAFMDRAVLEGDPHAVLEGMMIAAYAIGARQGWFYIRAEYPLAVARIEQAIRQARRHKLLGKNIFGTDFQFDCEVRLGAGAFVCGEETALLHSIEGKRGTPRPRPPYPSERGLWDKPSCINNVETLANVRHVILRGPDWFADQGTATSKGTKVFAITGKLNYTGLIEVPMGMPLGEIVERIGGGSSTGKAIKAVQTGGPSGGLVPMRLKDTPVCYEALRDLGSMMGSGGMIVMDQDDSMVDIARFYLGFTVDESCGKCAPCRVGGVQMMHLLQKILDGKATRLDLDMIRRLARAMEKASLCGLGQTAANPVTSSLRYFEKEYTDRIDMSVQEETHEWSPLRTARS